MFVATKARSIQSNDQQTAVTLFEYYVYLTTVWLANIQRSNEISVDPRRSYVSVRGTESVCHSDCRRSILLNVTDMPAFGRLIKLLNSITSIRNLHFYRLFIYLKTKRCYLFFFISLWPQRSKMYWNLIWKKFFFPFASNLCHLGAKCDRAESDELMVVGWVNETVVYCVRINTKVISKLLFVLWSSELTTRKETSYNK